MNTLLSPLSFALGDGIPGRICFFSLLFGLWVAPPCLANPAGNLVTPRADHTATLLTDGQVLLAAGYDGSTETASAELYNPTTNSWKATGSLNQAREFHAACRLADGRVLVAGGENAGANRLNSAELYDPATGKWTFTGSLTAARAFFDMVLLANGQVLAVDGLASLVFSPAAELYNPSTGTWTTTGSPNTASRNRTHLTVLLDGRVLLAGGGAVQSEVYDPSTGTWSFTGSMTTAHTDYVQLRLADGRVLAAGGYRLNHNDIQVLSKAEIYDPATGLWTRTGSLKTARRDFSADLLPNGRVFATGGTDSDTNVLATIEEYDPVTGQWRSARSSLDQARAGHSTVTLLNGNVLVAGGDGGFNNPGEIAEAELFIRPH